MFWGRSSAPILFQLPPSVEFDANGTTAFLTLLREMHNEDVALEPRHESWLERGAGDLFTEFRVARVAADPGVILDARDPAGWDGIVYFRLHGSPRKYYLACDSDFLGSLTRRVPS
jgi:uncharacterized protein YecE (DUF72 family)